MFQTFLTGLHSIAYSVDRESAAGGCPALGDHVGNANEVGFLVSYSPIDHHSFNFANGTGWIESLWAYIDTIHDGMTAK